MEKKRVKIKNISCSHCANTVEREILEIEGIISAKVDTNTSILTIELDETVVKWEQIMELLEDINYPPENSARLE